jgi:catechol 2,3-dioxygenase-like lactoylglutathione lyase family enzyme
VSVSSDSRVAIPTYDTIDHIGITVPDLEAAVAFFTEVFGAELWYEEGPSEDPQGEEMWRELRVHPRASLRLAMLRFGSSTTVELLEYRVPPGEATATAPRNSDHSASHLGLRVGDVDAAAEYLRGVPGVEVLAGPQSVPDGLSAGLRWVYFLTPWGLTMELVQLPAGMVV